MSTVSQHYFACPRCKTDLERLGPEHVRCPQDGLEFVKLDGIWRFLLPEGQAHYEQFMREYQVVRELEGRGSTDPAYYRALPFEDLSGKFSADWAIRARSYRTLLSRVIHPRLLKDPTPLSIVDIGAGNGWLSSRLTREGHKMIAVDLLVNETDGLAAWKYHGPAYTCLQADFNHLPLADGLVDGVIFNASFHYSEAYETTLRESLRLLRPRGWLLVMDSPVYHRADSGRRMLAERAADFRSRFGFASNALASEGFLTYERMKDLAGEFGLRWRHIRPNYGLRWRVRFWRARLRGGREPAEFGLWLADYPPS